MIPSPSRQQVRSRVLSASRRFVSLWNGEMAFEAQAATKAIDLVAGDLTFPRSEGAVYVVDEIEPQKNRLSRFLSGKEKVMVANLDLLMIVTAVGDVFNPVAIDRMLAIARQQEIPRTLVLNKIDLGCSDALSELIAWYEGQGIDVLRISAKHNQGLDAVKSDIFRPGVEAVAMTGVSGVGKSTLLNALVPEAGIRTGDLSTRTGQGKQTTSQVTGYVMKSGNAAPSAVIYDLPGIQKVGIGHLTKEDVIGEFAELRGFSCAFSDCSHINEDDCAVKDAVDNGAIPVTRYNSYVGMIAEIEEERRY